MAKNPRGGYLASAEVWFWAEMLDNGMSGRWRCHVPRAEGWWSECALNRWDEKVRGNYLFDLGSWDIQVRLYIT